MSGTDQLSTDLDSVSLAAIWRLVLVYSGFQKTHSLCFRGQLLIQIIRQSSHHVFTVTSLSDALVLAVILMAHIHILCYYGCTGIASAIMGAVCISVSPLVSFLQQVISVNSILVFVRNDGKKFLTRA